MIYLGDFPADQAIYFMWNTADADGASITRSTDGTISVYKDNSDGSSFNQTQVTTGVTNDEDVDGLTGVHSCCITTTNAWYETGHDYTVVLSASTIDTQTVNVIIAHFSIENRFMRGTNSAALAATALTDVTWTDAKAAFLNHSISTVDGVVDGIQTDLSNATDGLGALKTLIDANQTDLNAILADTDDIGVAGAGLTAVPWNAAWDTEVQSECNDALIALNLDHLIQHASTVSDAGATATDFYTALSEGTDDHYNKMIIVFTSGVLAGQARIISDYDGGFKGITVSPAFTEAPANSDPFIILPLYSEIMRGTEGANTTVPDAAGVAPTVGEIRTEMEGAGSKILAIEGDTNELQTNQGAWATATGFSTHSAANVWAVATRILTANTNFNDLDAAAIKAEVVAALADIKLDHLINIAVDTNWATTVHLDSVIGHLADVGTAATFDRTADALEAIRNRGDGAWITATGFNTTTPPTVGEIRTEMEGAGTKLLAIEGYTDKIDDATNGLTAIKAEVEGLAGAAMRGTDGANTTVPDAAGVAPTVGEIRTEMEGAGSKILAIEGDTNELQTNQGAWATAVGFSTHAAADVKTAIEAAGSTLAQILEDTGTSLPADIAAVGGYLLDAEIATVTDQTHITLATGSDVDDAYKDQTIVLYDDTNSDFPSVRKITAYTGATKAVTIDSAADFTVGADDSVRIFVTAPGTTAPTVGEIADAVWDEILTGTEHNIATSAGLRVRQIGAFAIHDGTAQAGNGFSITLAATAAGDDGVYNRNLIVLVDNTGAGQTRTIVDYNATSKVCVVDREWRVSPDATTAYQIVPDDTPLTVDHGRARGGTSTTVILRDYASSVDDTYLCNQIGIIAGPGRGQSRLVGAYNGTSKVVTICGDPWVTTPTTDSIYVMMPYGTTCTSCIGDHALDLIKSEADDALSDVNLHKHDQNMKAIAFSEY